MTTLIYAMDQNISVVSDMSDKAETIQHHVHGKRLLKTGLNKYIYNTTSHWLGL